MLFQLRNSLTFVRNITDIYELRVRHQRVNYRMLYFFHGRIAVVISHGLVKEQVVPPKEIDRAVERKEKFERDPDKHSYSEN